MDAQDVLKKYGSVLEKRMNTSTTSNYSSEYKTFKEEMAPELNRYERWCKSLGSVIRLNPSSKDNARIMRNLSIAHLDVEPWQAFTLSIMTFLAVFFLGLFVSVGVALVQGGVDSFPFLFFFLIILLSLFSFYFVQGYPQRLASMWRLKASSQMVPAILYIVVYMRHTPNLEKAISFAADHLSYPLALDFKKIFYNVQVGKFSTIKESLDNYLEVWRDYSIEFIEAFHLIESSLFEPDNTRRIQTLEKGLQVVLDGVYDKMLRFTHDVRSPLTNVYMLGVVLPTLGLALLPLASAMVGDYLRWYHVFILFNLVVPFFVFYLTDKILLLRPGGHGETRLLERNPLYYKYTSSKPYIFGLLVALPFLFLGILPLIFGYTPLPTLLGIPSDFTFADIGLSFFGTDSFFDFKSTGTGVTGPFGVGALLMGMLFPLGISIFFITAFKMRTEELILARNSTVQLEQEFNNSLFQLGNRLGNGVPPEMVFGTVAESSRGLITEDFFRKVNYNIRQMGMDVESAIFDSTRGAISLYPSDLIATSMRVLIESSKKGLSIAAVSLMSISEYVRNIGKITERLRDLLAEITSDMKSNMTFLAPLLSGIVVGLSAMITAILVRVNLAELGSNSADLGTLSTILDIFNVTSMIPPYFLQIAVGIYLIQIIFILTGALVVVDAGEDKLQKTHKTAGNLKIGMTLYFITALFSTIALFLLSRLVLGNVTG